MDALVGLGIILLFVTVTSIPSLIIVSGQDTNKPIVDITSPNPCEDSPGSKQVIVQGTASDKESGIEKVEAFAHTLPFNKKPQYELVEQINNNWSNWKIKLNVPENELYRVLARVTDKEGNQNWNDVTITPRTEIAPESNNTRLKIAFVHPTFTSTAYSPDSFYTFYPKYKSVNETAEIDLLNTTINHDEDRKYYQTFIDSLRKHLPDTSIKILRDHDVHDNAIFQADNQTNAFDAVVLLHNEYVTEKEYYNLKKFVENGGALILVDGNVLYAEVKYDSKSCSIRLVEGHDWVVANGTAKSGPHERWLNENKEWMGSNFLWGDIAEPVRFMNNPFNYTHFEENYISNKDATIFLDYLANIPANMLKDNNLSTTPTIGTYELSVGKGKVLAVSLYGSNLALNNKFVDWFTKTVIQHAVGNHKAFDYAGKKFVIYWNAPGNISNISVDKSSKSISLTFINLEKNNNTNNNNNNNKSLILSIPRELIDSPNMFGLTVNSQVLEVNASRNDIENIFTIPIVPGNNTITIEGKTIPPSFSVKPRSDLVVNATGKDTRLELSPPVVEGILSNNYSITNDAPKVFSLGKTIVNWTVTQNDETAYKRQTVTVIDRLRPHIDITSPNPCEDSPGAKQVIVQGTASDKESGIEKVDVFAHTFPFNNQFPYELAERVNSNWSNWKKILNVTENEPYRISARATDREGNENWDEVTIGMPSDSCNNIQ
jgi:hypothetical protein